MIYLQASFLSVSEGSSIEIQNTRSVWARRHIPGVCLVCVARLHPRLFGNKKHDVGVARSHAAAPQPYCRRRHTCFHTWLFFSISVFIEAPDFLLGLFSLILVTYIHYYSTPTPYNIVIPLFHSFCDVATVLFGSSLDTLFN